MDRWAGTCKALKARLRGLLLTLRNRRTTKKVLRRRGHDLTVVATLGLEKRHPMQSTSEGRVAGL